MSAVHSQMINDNTTDPFGIYNTPDYINEIKYISNAVFFEGSYNQFPSTSLPQFPNWYTYVYQDMFLNINLEKSLIFIKKCNQLVINTLYCKSFQY